MELNSPPRLVIRFFNFKFLSDSAIALNFLNASNTSSLVFNIATYIKH